MTKGRRGSFKEPIKLTSNGSAATSVTNHFNINEDFDSQHTNNHHPHSHPQQLLKPQQPTVIILHVQYRHLIVIVCSILVSIGYLLLYGGTLRFQYKQLQYLPTEHYLQVRDDFAIYRTVAENAEQYSARQELKNFYDNDGTLVISAPINDANVKEALSSLRLAVDMQASHKYDKAHRLFEHAYALAPKHPEVLLRYGEYLEHTQRDIVLADQYYFKALIVNPGNTEAIANRQRTAAIVQNLDEDHLLGLDRKRDALSGIHESNAALRRAKKEAYFQHIYHSVGIEGNTMTLAQTRSILETRTAIDGKSIDEHNEILGLDLAMKYINASLVNKMEISLQDIMEIHRRVLGHVNPIEGGEFRQTQVYVGGHTPPGPGDLSILMRRFENWLNSEQTMSLHPIKLAAFAHYKLVHIHPFIDGNGRTSRLLMNTLLMRAGYPPIIIPKQQRHNYYLYLQMANEGDIRPFVRFIADCTENTLNLYLWATSDLPNQIPLLAQTEHTLTNFEQMLRPTVEAASSAASSSTSPPFTHRSTSLFRHKQYFSEGKLHENIWQTSSDNVS